MASMVGTSCIYDLVGAESVKNELCSLETIKGFKIEV